MLLNPHELYTHRILDEIGAGGVVSQRSLARSMGIALGLTNLLVCQVVRKGLVRVIRIKRNRVRYLLTPAGIAEKARMSRKYLQHSIRFYVEARERIRGSFALLSAQWPDAQCGGPDKRIAFFGTSEVAEIGYVCLQETDLHLVAVIDDRGRQRFFDVPIHRPGELTAEGVGERAFDRLVVMSFDDTADIRGAIERTGFMRDRVFWI